MTASRSIRRKARRASGQSWLPLVLGLLLSMLVTLVGVALFALLMQWIRPSDQVIRVFNQLLKLVSISVGVWYAVRKRGEGGLLQGALLGLLYMVIGVAAYALLSGQGAPLTSYLADLGMGVAGGGIVGLLLGRGM